MNLSARTAAQEIRHLGDLADDRLSQRQKAEAFGALVQYLAAGCEKSNLSKKALVLAVETACAWADSNVRA